jgi:parallel beta-helix repeat protein
MARQKTAGVLVLAVLRPLVDEVDRRARRRVIDLLMPAQMPGRRLRDNNGGNMTVIEKARMGMIVVAAVMLESFASRLMGARRLSSGVMMLVVAGAVLLVVAGGAGADTPINPGDIPFTADQQNERYYLIDDLSMPTGECGPGITITADGITIDGMGYTITGNVASCSCANIYGSDPGETFPSKHSGIYNAAQSDLTIKDLEIIGFCTGIVLGSQEVTGNTITGCNIHHNGKAEMVTHGIHGVGLIGNTITKCEIHHITGGPIDDCGGGGNGIFFYGGTTLSWGNYNNVTCNYLHDNNKSGFFMKMKCMHNIISSNTATGNDEGGITLMCMKSNYNTIEDNDVSENLYTGIYIGGKNNTIRYNTVLNNRYYGINMGRSDGSYNNEIYGNVVCGNENIDIKTCGPECYGNHGHNNTCNTTQYYNDDGTTGCTYDCEYSEVGCVAEDGTVFGCGDTVTKICTFNGDMNCSTRYGLIIGADNITIDGAGYVLERADPGECTLGPSAGILNKGYDDVTIIMESRCDMCSTAR